jgi:hypothetical protein
LTCGRAVNISHMLVDEPRTGSRPTFPPEE